MKRIIIIPILFFTILLGGCVNNELPSVSPDTQTSAPGPVKSTFNVLSESQDGIEVTVEDIRKENGKTIVELAMNNHRYDLGAMDTENRSSFSGNKPSEYNIITSAMGGHHVQAEMIFAGELAGSLTIGLDENLIFDFYVE